MTAAPPQGAVCPHWEAERLCDLANLIFKKTAQVPRPALVDDHCGLTIRPQDYRPEQAGRAGADAMREAAEALIGAADGKEPLLWLSKKEVTRALASWGYSKEEALKFLRWALPRALCRRARRLDELGDWDGAIVLYDRAVWINPSDASAQHNRACLLDRMGRRKEAISGFDAAVALDPNDPEHKWARAFPKLKMGDLPGGWADMEYGKDVIDLDNRKTFSFRDGSLERLFPERRWHGEDLAGRTLLLYGNSGYGDTIQFVRFAADLGRFNGRIVLAVRTKLIELMKTVSAVDAVADVDTLPAFHLHVPLTSLGIELGITLDHLPGHVRYLRADPEKVEEWRRRLSTLDGLKVGIVWQGNRTTPADKRRSCTPREFAALAGVPGVSFVSLQKVGEVALIRYATPGFVVHDWTRELHSFADTAALVEALDLVIAVDTAVAHLAGALGKPVWILYRYDQCWRWLEGRTDSPWYPTARLFRQRRNGDWPGVFAEVRTALEELVGLKAAA